MSSLAIPTVHMNGSSKENLITDLCDAREAIRVALERMGAVCPNGRDYYPQGPQAIQEALRQHANRLHHLKAVHDELGDIALLISEGGHRA